MSPNQEENIDTNEMTGKKKILWNPTISQIYTALGKMAKNKAT